MKLFKIFTLMIFTLSLKGSFAGSSEIDKYVLSSENRIKESIEQILSSNSYKNAPDLCLFLKNEISETLLALETNSFEEEKKEFTDFVLKNVINNQPLNSLFLNFAIINTVPVGVDLSAWQNRALEKFLNIYKKNESLISNEDKVLFKEAGLVNNQFLCLEGKKVSSDKTDNFTILNYNYLAMEDSATESFAKEISSKNPDIICLEGVFLNEDVKLLYDQLKESYAYFYVDIDSNSDNLNSGLFVASKFGIALPQMHFSDDSSYFDFLVLNNQNQVMGRVYLFDFQLMKKDSSDIEKFISKLDSENLRSSTPILICGNFKEEMNTHTKLSTFNWLLQEHLSSNQDMVKFANEQFRLNGNECIFSVVKSDFSNENKLLKTAANDIASNEVFANENNMNYKMKNSGFKVMLCSNKNDGAHGNAGATVEESDNMKEVSVHGDLSYTKTTESGVEVTVSAEAEVVVDDHGNESHSAKASIDIGFKK